jgi:hypothetical protein
MQAFNIWINNASFFELFTLSLKIIWPVACAFYFVKYILILFEKVLRALDKK